LGIASLRLRLGFVCGWRRRSDRRRGWRIGSGAVALCRPHQIGFQPASAAASEPQAETKLDEWRYQPWHVAPGSWKRTSEPSSAKRVKVWLTVDEETRGRAAGRNGFTRR
jgi:hypothetical protein